MRIGGDGRPELNNTTLPDMISTVTPIRYATTAAIPARYNFAEAKPNATFPQYWLARSTPAKATHRIYRGASGAALRTVSLG